MGQRIKSCEYRRSGYEQSLSEAIEDIGIPRTNARGRVQSLLGVNRMKCEGDRVDGRCHSLSQHAKVCSAYCYWLRCGVTTILVDYLNLRIIHGTLQISQTEQKRNDQLRDYVLIIGREAPPSVLSSSSLALQMIVKHEESEDLALSSR